MRSQRIEGEKGDRGQGLRIARVVGFHASIQPLQLQNSMVFTFSFLSNLQVMYGVGVVERVAVDVVERVYILQGSFAVLKRPQHFFRSVRVLNTELPDHHYTFLNYGS